MADERTSPHGLVRHGPYPELTWTAVLVGYALGSIICISIGYASLILGFSIEGSELAAILGWGVLRGALRRTSIVENNINQTLASSVNGASAGMMFSVPALFILNRQYPGVSEFSAALMVMACISGGLIGLAFIIPLRKQMIDFNRLAYPGGIAVAAILKSPGAGLRKAMFLLGGAAVSGVVHVMVLQFAGSEDFPLGALMGWPAFLNLTFYLSLLTVGVGFLSGRGGLIFGLGGFLCYWLLSPLLIHFGAPDVQALAASAGAAVPNAFRGALFRPLGIGILIGAAIGGIVAALPLMASAIRSMQDAAKQKAGAARGASTAGATSDELPIRLLYGMIGAGGLVLMAMAFLSVPSMTLGRAAAMAGLGTLWIWVAGVIEGILGGDVPAFRYAAGAGLGAILSFSGLGGIGVLIGLGFYMPFNIVLTYTIGCGLRIFIDRARGQDFSENIGIPVAAGLIVGEALVGVGTAMAQVFGAL